MTPDQGERISSFILEEGITDVLELGFRHGVSTVYMATALARVGRGRIVTVDLLSAKHNQPNIEELLSRVGERQRVDVFYEPTCYTWRLMRLLEQDPTPRFDLFYLNGAPTGSSTVLRSYSSTAPASEPLDHLRRSRLDVCRVTCSETHRKGKTNAGRRAQCSAGAAGLRTAGQDISQLSPLSR
jgi:hypothetical protein